MSTTKNMQKPPYLAKGGVQTPPAGYRSSSNGMGSRKHSEESSGMMSMGSCGNGSLLNEGTSSVQMPRVKEFKTQNKLNNM